MEENYQNEISSVQKNEKRNTFFYIITIEFITVAVILISLICMKFFFKSSFEKFSKWYKDSFLSQTSISEVLDEVRE